MSPRTRFVLIGMGLTLLGALIFGGLHLRYAVEARTDEYRTQAELRAWAFADRVAFSLRQQAESMSLKWLVSAFVIPGGDVLYAQVVNNGEILAEASLLRELPSSSPSSAPGLTIETRSDGTRSFWDIQRALPDAEGFVRLGIDLAPLRAHIREQALMVVGAGVGFLAVAGVLLAFVSQRIFHIVPGSGQTWPATEAASADTMVHIGPLTIDEAAKRVELGGDPIELSPKEFELLSLLAQEPGRVYSTEEILGHVWADSHLAGAQDVKQYVYFLRQKLERDPKHPRLILTVRGFGYRLESE